MSLTTDHIASSERPSLPSSLSLNPSQIRSHGFLADDPLQARTRSLDLQVDSLRLYILALFVPRAPLFSIRSAQGLLHVWVIRPRLPRRPLPSADHPIHLHTRRGVRRARHPARVLPQERFKREARECQRDLRELEGYMLQWAEELEYPEAHGKIQVHKSAARRAPAITISAGTCTASCC
jgi:hypothetical protein